MRDLNVGDKLDQYQLQELLARSGMASIFKALDTESGGTVALKIPHPQYESDVVFFERFRREETIGQKINHPNVVRVLTPRAKSRMYVAMEFAEGRSLRALMSEQRRMPVDKALDIVRQICEALAHLHGLKIVHRDIKPENVLVGPDGRIKLLDFGIALDESARRLTWAGLSSTMGTPDYMAPEQVGGRRGDQRTDVYAVGTLLYEMLTGALPFSGTNAHSLLKVKAREDPRPPTYHVPGFDPSLEAIILRALERSPRDRYATIAELLADLRNPSAVPPRDPEAARARRGGGLRLPRGVGMFLAVLATVAGLSALIWLSARHSVNPPRPALPHSQN